MEFINIKGSIVVYCTIVLFCFLLYFTLTFFLFAVNFVIFSLRTTILLNMNLNLNPYCISIGLAVFSGLKQSRTGGVLGAVPSAAV